MLAIEGPAWMVGGLGAQLEDPARRARLFRALERVEAAPSLLGASAHLMAIGTRR